MTNVSGTGAPLFFALPGNESFAERLAIAVDGEIGDVWFREFPDGESYVRVETNAKGRDVVIVATLRHPNEQLLPLVFLADALREFAANRVGLVAPYLAYMRQDARFHEGEAVTSRSFAALLSRSVDWLLTVDPHLHRFKSLSELYSIPADAVHVAREMGEWIGGNVTRPLIIGPDAESAQWVDGVAAAARAPSIVLTKIRRGDVDVIESLPELKDYRANTPVVVDDMISSGQTMMAAVQHLRRETAIVPMCVAAHAVFADGAYDALRAAGASRVVTTNTIPHRSNGIDVIPALATALRARLAG